MADTISIVTGVRNGARYIRETIESVRQQLGPRVEHVVVDGASTDGTVEILRSYPHLRWISEPDHGQGEALAKGFRMATGSIFCMLPADDLLLPGAVDAMLDVFDRDPGCQWATGLCRIVDAEGREIRRGITAYKNLLLRFHSFPLLLSECYLSAMSVFFRRSLYESCGPYDLDRTTEYDLWLHFAQRAPLCRVPRYTAAFRVHTASETGSYRVFPARRAFETARRHGAGHPVALLAARLNYWRLVMIYAVLNRLLRG